MKAKKVVNALITAAYALEKEGLHHAADEAFAVAAEADPTNINLPDEYLNSEEDYDEPGWEKIPKAEEWR